MTRLGGTEHGAGRPVVVVPGLDSSKEEFHDVAAALLRRRLAVFAVDGPGQGVLAATTTVRADYHHVIGQVIDALGLHGVGLVGLSFGGYYVAESAVSPAEWTCPSSRRGSPARCWWSTAAGTSSPA
ncbi:alpha/beta fold hydrolase [Nonomuraea phyllanthi]|uniref:alpha/beta fold hydrolase n=1 Tax=Nonomuraea phyllanthi TaxID=2219224 RepID=UPI001D13B3FC|nr:alpha/beta hydrolase [Nonomuraea phyllanthi]